jgi:aromatic-L-amino-acid decarboxylase
MAPDEPSLDPDDWDALRALGHRMLDDMFDYVQGIRGRPVWQRLPDSDRAALRCALPRPPGRPEDIYEDFRRLVLPYATGNVHPRFMGWVHGGGNVIGMLAELLAGGLNANLGGRDHAPILVERQVITWAAEMLGLPADTSGVLVTGTSIANMIAVLVARVAALGPTVRHAGVGGRRLVAYASASAHSCIPRAVDMAGLGTAALRLIACGQDQRMDLKALTAALQRDRQDGAQPFLVVATAGTVDTGAFDDLAAIARLCREQGLWFHVDGAFGALAALSPALRPLLRGVEQADSVAFDFHKWAQVPYDAGCILVRDPALHLATFSQQAAYLRREARGLAGGSPWPCDLGPDLSRGFRALKVWMTLRTYGADRLGAIVAHCCAVARALAARVEREPALELMAPVTLNIVCFRYRAAAGGLDDLNTAIVADLQETGIAAPSTTILAGAVAVRAAIVNHRTRIADAEALVEAVLQAGAARVQGRRSAGYAPSAPIPPSQARTPTASPNASGTRSPMPPTDRA